MPSPGGAVSRYLLWVSSTAVCTEALLQALSRRPEVVESLTIWPLFGMGYFLGQFFQLKWVYTSNHMV